MAVKDRGTQLININNPGARIHIDTSSMDYLTVTVPAYMLLGDAVLELKRTAQEVAYSTAKTIDSSTPVIIAAEVKSLDQAVLVLTTKDDEQRDVRVDWFGEEES